MQFNKEILYDYIKKENINNHGYNYIYVLYKNYNNLNKLTNDKVHLMKKQINEIEKKIYTVRGKEISDYNRLKLEIALIKRKYLSDNQEDAIKQEIIGLENSINVIDKNDYKKIFYFKKQISILQAKLKIKPSFLYAAYCVFEDLYTNIFIKHICDNNKSGLQK